MKKIDENGYWILKANPISRVGVFEYLGSQIDLDGKMGLDKNRRYNVLRPANELFDRDAMESFTAIPFINDHEMLGEGFTPVEKRSPEGTISNVRESLDEPGVLIADIKIYTKSMKDRIIDGKKGLSLGYYCEYAPEMGVYDGKTYEFVQKNLRGNHLALVSRPRNDVYVQDSAIGVTVMTIDSAIEEITPMNETQKKDGEQKNAETPDQQLAKLLTGQDPEACKATLDFLNDFLAKRKSADTPKTPDQKPSTDNDGTPPPPPKKEGEGDGAPAAGGEEAPGAEGAPDNSDKPTAVTAEPGANLAESTPAPTKEGDNGGEGQPTGDSCCGKTAKDGCCGKKEGCDGKECQPGDPNCDPDKGGEGNPGDGEPQPTQTEATPTTDEAVRQKFFKEFAKAHDLAEKVSNLTGTFDSSEMTEADVAVYGCKKLGLAFDESVPATAIFAISAALRFAKQPEQAVKKATLDSAVPAKSAESDTQKCVEAYFGK